MPMYGNIIKHSTCHKFLIVLIMLQGQINWMIAWIYAPRHAASKSKSKLMLSVQQKRVQ